MDQAPIRSLRYPRLRETLRSLRLQMLGPSSWKSQIEHRKVAIFQSRRVAVSHSLLHFCPLSGAVSLQALRASRYWVGDTSPDTTFLQFVAKFYIVQIRRHALGLRLRYRLDVDKIISSGPHHLLHHYFVVYCLRSQHRLYCVRLDFCD